MVPGKPSGVNVNHITTRRVVALILAGAIVCLGAISLWDNWADGVNPTEPADVIALGPENASRQPVAGAAPSSSGSERTTRVSQTRSAATEVSAGSDAIWASGTLVDEVTEAPLSGCKYRVYLSERGTNGNEKVMKTGGEGQWRVRYPELAHSLKSVQVVFEPCAGISLAFEVPRSRVTIQLTAPSIQEITIGCWGGPPSPQWIGTIQPLVRADAPRVGFEPVAVCTRVIEDLQCTASVSAQNLPRSGEGIVRGYGLAGSKYLVSAWWPGFLLSPKAKTLVAPGRLDFQVVARNRETLSVVVLSKDGVLPASNCEGIVWALSGANRAEMASMRMGRAYIRRPRGRRAEIAALLDTGELFVKVVDPKTGSPDTSVGS